MTVNTRTGKQYVYAQAMLLPVFDAHMGPQCIVGEGVAERSHLLQNNRDVLSHERKDGEK